MAEVAAQDSRTSAEAVLQRLPRRWRPTLDRMLAHWPGRILWATVAAFVRVELFDRSMAIAAQFFTSVFPTVIMLGTLVGGGEKQIADAVDLPAQSEVLLEDALTQTNSAAFGVAGALIVLAAATSLSRALTRAYASIWMLPRPRAQLSSAWRWLAVVIGFALVIVLVPLVKRYASELPPSTLWETATAALIDTALVVLVPWILLSGRIPLRQLLAGGVLFAALMLVVRPASARWLPHALEVSSDRYGTFGVAFTYLAWLYVVSWCLLVASALGQVVTMDPGWLGRSLRGERDPRTVGWLREPDSPAPGEAEAAAAEDAEDSSVRRTDEEPAP